MSGGGARPLPHLVVLPPIGSPLPFLLFPRILSPSGCHGASSAATFSFLSSDAFFSPYKMPLPNGGIASKWSPHQALTISTDSSTFLCISWLRQLFLLAKRYERVSQPFLAILTIQNLLLSGEARRRAFRPRTAVVSHVRLLS